MPDTSKGAAGAEPKQRMPTSTKVATILLGVLAALLLLNAILGFGGLTSILDNFAEAARDRDMAFDRDAARTQLLILFIAGAVLGLAAGLACYLLAKRNRSGRIVGIATAGIQLSLAVLNAIGIGGLLNYTLLLIVLTTAILVMLFRNQTAEWLRSDRDD